MAKPQWRTVILALTMAVACLGHVSPLGASAADEQASPSVQATAVEVLGEVPEPLAMTLWGIGLAGVASRMRRRQRLTRER